MKVLGLTGGIASGKSSVSKLLMELGAHVIDADKIAREIVEPGRKALELIIEEFGFSVLNMNGTLNRKFLGDIVFNSPDKLAILNRITHPEIKKITNEKIGSIRRSSGESVVVIDAAVLLESGMDEFTDEVWLVYVDYDTQLKRLMARDNIDIFEAEARIKSQMPVEEKIIRSDKIIDNTKDLQFTKVQVENLWHDIKNSGGRPVASKT